MKIGFDLRFKNIDDDLSAVVNNYSYQLQREPIDFFEGDQIELRLYATNAVVHRFVRMLLKHLFYWKGEGYYQTLFFAVRELILNAEKANFKRIYHKREMGHLNLDIEKNYMFFLQNFMQTLTQTQEKNLTQGIIEEDQFFDLLIERKGGRYWFKTITYFPLYLQEKQMINEKIVSYNGKVAQPYVQNGMEDPIEDPILPKREGAGLGIHLILSILERLGEQNPHLHLESLPNMTEIGFSISSQWLSPKKR